MVAGIVLFVLSVVALGESSEPQCSRFHYEEKTLEKMIKTEIYVDKIKADTDDMHREMTEEFKGLREDMDNTKREVSDVKDQNIKFVNEIKERLDDSLTSRAVAFHAHNLAKTDYNEGETLVFSTTYFDIGSGYNNSTGIYITPVAGIYILTLQLCISNTRYVYFEIAKDKVPVLKGCFNDDAASYSGCEATSVVALLGAKENVWIKVGSSTTGADFWKQGTVWNSFSGVLVSAISN